MNLSADRDSSYDDVHVCGAPAWVRDADLSLLTAREREVLFALGDCLSNADIAGRWFVTERTVKKHVTGVFTKLEISSRAEAAVIATYKKCAVKCP